MADHFVKVASALESYGTCSSSIFSPDSTLKEQIHIQDLTCKHTILSAEYNQLLKEIWDLPDFYDFLQPPNATYLFSSLPSDGPVVLFNVYTKYCDALVLIAGTEEPLHTPLEHFSFAQAETLSA